MTVHAPIAVGVNPDGHRELLGLQVFSAETAPGGRCSTTKSADARTSSASSRPPRGDSPCQRRAGRTTRRMDRRPPLPRPRVARPSPRGRRHRHSQEDTPTSSRRSAPTPGTRPSQRSLAFWGGGRGAQRSLASWDDTSRHSAAGMVSEHVRWAARGPPNGLLGGRGALAPRGSRLTSRCSRALSGALSASWRRRRSKVSSPRPDNSVYSARARTASSLVSTSVGLDCAYKP